MEQVLNGKKELAIIGACCSRDMLNSQFVSNWKDYIDLKYYAFQTSFISLMSAPVPYSRQLIKVKTEKYSEWYSDIFEKELNKSILNDLLALNPDNLLIDFYSDVVNGVLELSGAKSFITQRLKAQKYNVAFTQLDDYKELKPLLHHDEYLALWEEAIQKFFAFISERLPYTNVILSFPKFTNEILNDNGTISDYKNADVERFNAIYSEMVERAVKCYPKLKLIALDGKYYIDPNYIFGGAWICHYHKNYYEDLIDAVYKNCIKNDQKTFTNTNLVVNSQFSWGTQFWKFFDRCFTYDRDKQILQIREANHSENIWAQAWTNDIPLVEGKKYNITFEALIESKVALSNKTIFVMRTFEKTNCHTRADAVEQIIVSATDTRDKWEKYSVSITPQGKYLSVGVYLTQNGAISWRNISVVIDDGQNTNAPERANILQERYGHIRLVDLNRTKLYE